MSALVSSPLRIVGVLLLAGALAAPLFLPTYYTSVATQILIFAVLAMSVDVLAGFAGRTPLCHGAIFGTSTYVVLYCVSVAHMAILPAILLGVLAATVLAMIFAPARSAHVRRLFPAADAGARPDRLGRVPALDAGDRRRERLARPAARATGLSTRELYGTVLAVVALVTFAMWRFVSSPFGLTLRGIKDSESRMASLGYNVPLHLFIAFTVSGFFAGVAGALYAIFNDFVSPSTVQLSQSVSGLLMAIVGGVGTLFGSFVGAFLIIALEQAVSLYTERWLMVLGLSFIVIMIFAPEGVVGKARLIMAARKASKSHQP